MAINGVKTKPVTLSISIDDLKYLDRMAKRLDMSRSGFVGLCVDMARDDIKMLDAVGLRIERVAAILQSLGVFRKRVSDAIAQGELDLS